MELGTSLLKDYYKEQQTECGLTGVNATKWAFVWKGASKLSWIWHTERNQMKIRPDSFQPSVCAETVFQSRWEKRRPKHTQVKSHRLETCAVLYNSSLWSEHISSSLPSPYSVVLSCVPCLALPCLALSCLVRHCIIYKKSSCFTRSGLWKRKKRPGCRCDILKFSWRGRKL